MYGSAASSTPPKWYLRRISAADFSHPWVDRGIRLENHMIKITTALSPSLRTDRGRLGVCEELRARTPVARPLRAVKSAESPRQALQAGLEEADRSIDRLSHMVWKHRALVAMRHAIGLDVASASSLARRLEEQLAQYEEWRTAMTPRSNV